MSFPSVPHIPHTPNGFEEIIEIFTVATNNSIKCLKKGLNISSNT